MLARQGDHGAEGQVERGKRERQRKVGRILKEAAGRARRAREEKGGSRGGQKHGGRERRGRMVSTDRPLNVLQGYELAFRP